MRHDPVSVLPTTATNAYAADVGQAAQTYADASAAWVDAESHAYAAYEQDLAAAHVALVSAIAPANVTYAHDAAQAWADYHVSMTGIQQDMDTAWAQLNVAQVNAADPSTFAYIYPQYGGSWAPMMPGGVSALSWAYFEAFSLISTLGMPEYTPPPNPPMTSSSLSLNEGSTLRTPSGFWNSLGNSLWAIWQGGVGSWQWGRSWFDGNVDYITTCQTAYDYGPLGQTQNSSGVYYYGTRAALAMSTSAAATASYLLVAEVAATGGLYNITTHGAERLAERGIPNAAVQWGLQIGTRHAAFESRKGVLGNAVNFVTKGERPSVPCLTASLS